MRKLESYKAHCWALSILEVYVKSTAWQRLRMQSFWAPPTCLELRGVRCVACWPWHTAPPGVGHCLEGSRVGEGSGESEGGGSGGCKGQCCCYPPTSLMIRCQRRCAPHLSWRCGWQRLGFRHIPSPLPASPETPASWPVFCDKHIENEKSVFLFVNHLASKNYAKIQYNFLTGKRRFYPLKKYLVIRMISLTNVINTNS